MPLPWDGQCGQADLRRLLQTGCGLHGYAGCAAALENGLRGVLATDLCRFLGVERCGSQPLFPRPEGSEAKLYEQTEQLLGEDSGQPLGEEDWRLDAPLLDPCWPVPEPFDAPEWQHGSSRAAARPRGGWLKRKLRTFFGGGAAGQRIACPPQAGSLCRYGEPEAPEEAPFPAPGEEELRAALLRTVTVTVEHQPGDRDAQDPAIVYTLNHGHVQQALAEENRWQDAYIYGESEAHEVFEGVVVAAFSRGKTGRAVWLVSRGAVLLSEAEVRTAVSAMEKEQPGCVVCL
jgi:hypothetical protein